MFFSVCSLASSKQLFEYLWALRRPVQSYLPSDHVQFFNSPKYSKRSGLSIWPWPALPRVYLSSLALYLYLSLWPLVEYLGLNFCLKPQNDYFMFFFFCLLVSKKIGPMWINSCLGWLFLNEPRLRVCLSLSNLPFFLGIKSNSNYDPCAVLLATQIICPWKVLSDPFFLKYTSLKERYASPICFSGFCSPERVTFENAESTNRCAVFLSAEEPFQYNVFISIISSTTIYIYQSKGRMSSKCFSGLCFLKRWKMEMYGCLDQTIWHRV